MAEKNKKKTYLILIAVLLVGLLFTFLLAGPREPAAVDSANVAAGSLLAPQATFRFAVPCLRMNHAMTPRMAPTVASASISSTKCGR